VRQDTRLSEPGTYGYTACVDRSSLLAIGVRVETMALSIQKSIANANLEQGTRHEDEELLVGGVNMG
jgi:hypothetical protein